MSNDLQIYRPLVPARPKPRKVTALVPTRKRNKSLQNTSVNKSLQRPRIKKKTSPTGMPSWQPVIFKKGAQVESNFWAASSSGEGMSYNDNVEVFIHGQLRRFRIPAPRQDFLIYCWDLVAKYITLYSPGCLFEGQSNVMTAYDHHYYQYATKNTRGLLFETRSDEIDIYRVNYNFNAVYDHHYHNPNLKNNMAGLEGYIYRACEKMEGDMDKYRRQYGDQLYTFMHFVSWAVVMWMVHKDNDQWRIRYSAIFSMCYEYGECLSFMGQLYSPHEYQKQLSRPAHSCARCGIRTTCVKPYDVNVSHESRYTGFRSSIYPTSHLSISGVNPGGYMFCERCAVENLRKHDKCRNLRCPIHKCTYNHYHQEPSLVP